MNDTRYKKVMSLPDAIERFVKNGYHISIGGFTINRNPMAAVHEIIRQKKRGFHLYAHSGGHGVDELIGGGCVEKIEIAYAGSGRFAPTCIRFRRAVENGSLLIEDYSNYQMTLRFMAGAMGVPFLPTKSSFGSDLIKIWGFSEELRKISAHMPDKKLYVMDNPFGTWGETEKVVLVPAINPDVTIIHVQKADMEGTARLEGLTFADIEQAKSAKYLIITCEELVAPEELRKNPDRNQIPLFCSDAVVHVPMGAYPTSCWNYYDYDPVYLKNYKISAVDDNLYQKYLKSYIYGCRDHETLLEKYGEKQINKIMADPKKGYASGLNRK